MKGTETDQVCPAFAQRHKITHDLLDAGSFNDITDGVGSDHGYTKVRDYRI